MFRKEKLPADHTCRPHAFGRAPHQSIPRLQCDDVVVTWNTEVLKLHDHLRFVRKLESTMVGSSEEDHAPAELRNLAKSDEAA